MSTQAPAIDLVVRKNALKTAFISGMASYLDAAAIVSTGTALVLFQEPLGISDAQIGQLSALLTVMIAVGAFTGGRLGDAYGRRRVFTVTMVLLLLLGAALLTVAPNLLLLYVGIALLGFASGADLPVSMAMIAESSPEQIRGKMISISHGLWMIAIVVVMVLGIVVGGQGATGARILYAHIAIVAVIVLALRFRLPESAQWQALKDQATSGQGGASEALSWSGVKQLFTGRYAKPLLATGLFYAIANIAANTNGQFSTYIYVNVAGSDVATASTMGLLGFGASFIGMIIMFRFVDSRRRMVAFAACSVLVTVATALPLIFGFSVAALAIGGVIGAIGGAMAGEPMYKVWSQELFPTAVRTTAQGTTIAFTRLVAAAVALVTPQILNYGPQVMYGFLIATVAISCLLGILWIARVPRADEPDAADLPGTATPVPAAPVPAAPAKA
ncbi:MFS transporter [Micrococcales bacterium 31B]|nr:MFS transporter [Micrococcales bacterium 31B]